jgi:hypothetical protein
LSVHHPIDRNHQGNKAATWDLPAIAFTFVGRRSGTVGPALCSIKLSVFDMQAHQTLGPTPAGFSPNVAARSQ